MKCVECADYAECSKKHNLTIKRKRCPMAKIERVQTNADRIREHLKNDESLAALYVRYNPNTDMHHTDAGVYHDFEGAMDAELEWLKQPAEVPE